jgi:G3E family GTPase
MAKRGDASIPIILVTGGLGAGKTTLLNQLLQHTNLRDRNLCLIINEFGQSGVDGRLVEAGDHPVYEINRGSLFCICIKTDFITTLREIAGQVRPELLVVEATGMAEPRDIQDFVDEPILAARFHIQANLCLVDASNFIRLAPMLRAVRQQAAWADALILNKTDLVNESELQQLCAVLEEMNPEASQLATTYGRIPEGFLDNLTHTVRRGDPLMEPPDPVFALSFGHDKPVNRARFEKVILELGDDLLRLKGQVDFGDGPEFAEVAGGRLIIGGKESIRFRAESPTAFVAIGWRAPREDFQAAIESIWA